jgi:hypothetical protein
VSGETKLEELSGVAAFKGADVKLLRGAVVLLAFLVIAIPATAEELARWDDPVGDDTGDGD